VVVHEEELMPKGKGHRFSAKEDRQAEHVAASERARGKSVEEARSIGYATVVNRGGGKGKKRGKK
jgi:hypothetical protein